MEASVHVTYIGERHGKFAHLTDGQAAIDVVHTVFSGKFRRYNGDSVVQRLFDIKTNMLNVRDAIYFLIGLIQSVLLLRRIRPDMVFLKGGYVGVPIGLASAMLKIPFITHDSDAVPGLANRLVARWATIHATAGPPEDYPYTSNKVQQVGVIVSSDYQPVSRSMQRDYKRQLGIEEAAKVLLVTGGSLGAQRINTAVKNSIAELMEFDDLYIIHQVGKGNIHMYDGEAYDRLMVYEFLSPMHVFTGAADAVITRAGANTLAELGVQGKACIVVPNDQLTDGHQTKNAELLKQVNAALVVPESKLNADLIRVVTEIFKSNAEREQLGEQLQSLTKTDASLKIAKMLLQK